MADARTEKAPNSAHSQSVGDASELFRGYSMIVMWTEEKWKDKDAR